MNLKYISLNILCLVFLTSCSLWKANEWNSHKVVLKVQDVKGAKLPGVKIQSLARHSEYTDELGQTTLFFTQTGLHVVTLRSANTLTKQIKIKTPDDANKIVIVVLHPK